MEKTNNIISFQNFIKQNYIEAKYQLLTSLYSLLIEKHSNMIKCEEICAIANLPEGRIYRYFPKGKYEMVECLLKILNQYIKKILFPLLNRENINPHINIKDSVTVLNSPQCCEAIKLLLAIDLNKHSKQFHDYYILWEIFLVETLYKQSNREPDMELVKYSIGIIHLPLFLQHFWKKTLELDKILLSLKNFWAELLDDVEDILASSDIAHNKSDFIPEGQCKES